MTHTEDLIFRLRDAASRGVSSWGDFLQEAADELQALVEMAKTDALLLQNLAEQLSAERLATELAVDAEREACAMLCWEVGVSAHHAMYAADVADLIRARGQA